VREIFILADEELARIHRTSLRVLGETGIVVAHEEALRLLQEHGARVDRDQQRAWIPEVLVTQALSTVAGAFTLAGSDPAHDVTLALNGPLHGRPLVGADFVVDPGATCHRPATLQDVEEWIRLADRLPNMHVNCGPYPTDVPGEIRDLLHVERVFEMSHKPVLVSHYSGAALRWSLELMRMLPDRGSPRLMVYVSCNSPLYFTPAQVEILLTAAEHKVPIVINSAALAGATAPYTLAGIAAQMNAEMLTGVVLAQLAQPGAPMLWSPLPLIFDMRTTASASGYAKNGLLTAAFVQLGKFYCLPTQCIGLVTDAVIPDAQAGLEKIMGSYASMLARPSIVGGAGGLSAFIAASKEQLVLDDDILGGMFRVVEGIGLDEDALARDAINRVGPRGQFLDDQHTLDYLRREYYFSQTANRLGAEAWASAGSPDVRARATKRARELLAAPLELAVSEDIAREMRRILQRAQADLTQTKVRG
jgi:trimethylamine--corrinoid protein Co-methyltransferase